MSEEVTAIIGLVCIVLGLLTLALSWFKNVSLGWVGVILFVVGVVCAVLVGIG